MDFFFHIRSIRIAHAFVLDEEHRCAYPEGRGQYGVVYAEEGEAEYRFRGGARKTVRAGELCLLSKDAAYSVHIPHIFRHYTVNFDLAPESRIPAPLAEAGFLVCESAPAHARLFERIAQLWQTPVAGGEMAAMACLYEILALAAEALSEDQGTAARRARLRPASEHLSLHFSESVSNAALAALCNMSETNFRREWARAYGMTPLASRDGLRMERAKGLLLHSHFAVGEIARICGFEDESYFGRFFKKHAGLSPGEFRKKSVIL